MSIFRRKRKNKGQNEGTILNEKSPFHYTESFKRLRTNVQFASMNGKLRKIMVTSALPEECKSTTSINLAISLAETQARVVLVDCDLRRANVPRYLGVKLGEDDMGVSNIISGGAKLEDCIREVKEHGIWMVSTGTIPPNPAELLNAPETGEMMDKLAEQFDYVIIDTAPVNVVSDAINLSRWCDGVVMTVRQNYTVKDEIRRAKEMLDAVKCRILGVVLVRYDQKRNLSSHSYGSFRPYSYYYSRKYRSYYYDYGYGAQDKQDKKKK